jgi:hypothetical protein
LNFFSAEGFAADLSDGLKEGLTDTSDFVVTVSTVAETGRQVFAEGVAVNSLAVELVLSDRQIVVLSVREVQVNLDEVFLIERS